jgi:hypothetical protein
MAGSGGGGASAGAGGVGTAGVGGTGTGGNPQGGSGGASTAGASGSAAAGTTGGGAGGTARGGSGGLAAAGAGGATGSAGAGGSGAGAGGRGGTGSEGPCLSGAQGNHVVRFRFVAGAGTAPAVIYEANTLPTTTRWRVLMRDPADPNYLPAFTDADVAEGGLDLGGTRQVDVELSFLGLGNGTALAASIAIYGRSLHATANGSFAWLTYNGGAKSAPPDVVANTVPYRWTVVNAPGSFFGGENGALLRLTPGPSSNHLAVNRVEVCLQAD